jgi:uncharacterized protein (DUF2236 family)
MSSPVRDIESERLAQLVAERARGEREGLFGPGSATWTILRETALLFGGPRALLLQLAHPSVAAGVAQHSVVASDPLGRSVRTFSAVYPLCFGDLASALAVVRAVRRRHAVVTGRAAAGAPYRALDPILLRWVHATLYDTAVRMFEALVRPIDPAERARFFDESKVVQIAFGVPPDEVLATPTAFDSYFASVLASGDLSVTSEARTQWETLVRTPPSNALAGAFLVAPSRRATRLFDALPLRLSVQGALRLFAAGTLPPRVRDAYGLRWGRRDAVAFDAVVATIRAAWRRLPAALRFHPAYRSALARFEPRYHPGP